MLLNLRKSKKVVIWTVVLSFVLWGGFSVGTQFKKEGRVAGNVFGKDISFQEYDRFYKATQLFNLSGAKDMKDPAVLRQSAWQGIIFSREAKRRKIDVSDEEIKQQILQLLEAQKIDPANYAVWVERALRESPKQFEDQVREVIRIQKLMTSIAKAIPGSDVEVTPEDAKKSFLQDQDQITFELRRFDKKVDAILFREKLKTAADWKKAQEATPGAFQQVGPLPTVNVAEIFQINAEETKKIQALEKDQISSVFNTAKEFLVFFVIDRKKPKESDFESSKDNYIEFLKDRKRQSLLLPKTHEILGRAQLKDYMPGEGVPSSS